MVIKKATEFSNCSDLSPDKNEEDVEKIIMTKLAEKVQQANYLNSILLDSLPHPALLVTKNRRVIAANKLAKEAGTLVDGFCWRDFGHCLYISEEQKKVAASWKSSDESDKVHCFFCHANEALKSNVSINIEQKLGDIYWDIFWVPTQEKDIYLHYAIDITERKKTENYYKDGQRIAHIGNIEIDLNKSTTYWSDEVYRIFGYQPQEISPDYNSYDSHLYENDKNSLIDEFKNRTPLDPSFNMECKFRKINGEKGWLSIQGSIEFDTNNSKPKRFFGIIQDITEKKEAELVKKANEENLKKLQDTLEMDRLKNEFLSNVSHEFRTPLNIILSSLQLFNLYLKDGTIIDNDQRISKRIDYMKQNCYRLLRLINNLIDLSKAEGNYMSLQLKTIDIVPLIRKLCLSVAEYIHDRNIGFTFKTSIQEKIITCDPGKVESILLNLISNAIKFNNPEGHITVSIRDKGEDIVVSVEDTGVGIPLEKQNRIFERFVQVDKSLTRSYEGSGIGLSLVKSFIDMHNGEIWLESEVGKGSVFSFMLPGKYFTEKDIDTSNTINPVPDQSLVDRISIEFSDIYK